MNDLLLIRLLYYYFVPMETIKGKEKSEYKLYQIVYVEDESWDERVTYLRWKNFWEIYEYLKNEKFRNAMKDIVSIMVE